MSTFRLLPLALAAVLIPAVAAAADVPLLWSGYVPVMEHRLCVPPEGRGNCVSLLLDVEFTNDRWLDTELIRLLKLEQDETLLLAGKSNKKRVQDLRKQADRWMDARLRELQEAAAAGRQASVRHEVQIRLLGQLYNLASVSITRFSPESGSRFTEYRTADLRKQTWLQLDHILNLGSHPQLVRGLAEAYRQQYPQLAARHLPEGMCELTEMFLTDSFLLQGDRLRFSYAPGELAPAAAGPIELQLDRELTQGLVRSNYLPRPLAADAAVVR